MRRHLPAMLGLALLLAASSLTHAENPVTVIEKAMKAHGGEDALTKFKARQNKTKGVVHHVNDIPFTQEVYYQAPGQIKEITQVEVGGKKATIVTILNGDQGSITMDGQAHEIDDKKLVELKEAAHLAQVSRFIGLRDKPYFLTMLPESKVDGKDAVGVRVSTKGFRDIDLYLDKENGLLIKTERQALDVASGQFVKEEQIYREWKLVNGMQTATRVSMSRDGKPFIDSEAVEIKFLERLEDSVFTMP